MAINVNIDSSDMAGKIRDLQKGVATGLVTIANAAGVTLTGAQFVDNTILRSGAAGVSDTTPTATLILAQLPNAAVGDVFSLAIQNNNSGTLTIVAGSGVTLSGTTSIATANTRHYKGKVTAVGTPAVTLYGINTSAV